MVTCPGGGVTAVKLVVTVFVGLLIGLLLGRYALAPTPKAVRTRSLVSSTAPSPHVQMDIASIYRSTAPQLGTLGRGLGEKISAATNGTVAVKFNEPGVVVPAAEVFDAVASGQIDAAWSTPEYWLAKDSAFSLLAGPPFGPPASEFMAWLYYGGGRELWTDLYSQYNIVSLPCGVEAPQSGGWFRKEIRTVDDLRGLRIRFVGLGARVMEKLGARPQSIPGGDTYQAFQLGNIDAAELSTPAVDLRLGIHETIKHYYFPGWQQQASFFDLLISQRKWDEMSPDQHRQLELACGDNFRESVAEGDVLQVRALQELRGKGVTFHRWPPAILAAFEKGWNAVVAEESESNANFKKVWESYSTFRAGYRPWKEMGYLP